MCPLPVSIYVALWGYGCRACVFYMQKRDDLLKLCHCLDFLSYESRSWVFFKKKIFTTGKHISGKENGYQNLLIYVKYSPCSMNWILHLMTEWWLCSSSQIKWMHSKPHWNFRGDKWTLGFLTCFKLQQKFCKRVSQGLLSPSQDMIT